MNLEDVEDIPIPLDGLTVRRLARFARLVGKRPLEAAGELLRDLLEDSDFWDAVEETDSIRH